MAAYLGDYVEDDTLHFIWSSADAAGASITRATDGQVRVYKDNNVAQSTAGVTDVEDFDGLTGIHACTIDLNAHAFYATGADYTVVLQGSIIDGENVNAVLAHFSIENRTNTLLATEAKQDAIQADTDDIQTRLPAALSAGGYMKADLQTWLTGIPGSLSGDGMDLVPADVQDMDANVIGADQIAESGANEIADAVLARELVELDPAVPILQTLHGAVSSMVNKRSINIAGDTLTLYRTDGVTVLATIAITQDPALGPIRVLTP